ncbi:MAG: methyltransferase domain-containing protein [Acidobacteria bacterium]|nr:methyltransferase domain-containing protein [Acidobacteriota bacterium]
MPDLDRRSKELERIDTGDYTAAEYDRFLREIAFINRFLGDRRALRRSLFAEVERRGLAELSLLDVGCGSGELLRYAAEFARAKGINARLAGLDLNPISARISAKSTLDFPEIAVTQGDAFQLPFADGEFDYAISSLFFHHLTDEQIPQALGEMRRVARRGVFVIDLHRHPVAYRLYRLYCKAFRISRLVTEDGSLSVLRGFRPEELAGLAAMGSVKRSFPFRLVLECGEQT